MKEKAERLFDAITLLKEDLVEEAQDYRFRKRPAVWRRVGSLAACLVLLASLSLLALPRGCGSSGGNSSPMDSADSCAPGEAPADGAVSGEPVPEPDAPAGAPEEGEQAKFDAVVIEACETGLQVEALEGQRERGLFTVSANGLELPELAAGDRVRITYDGKIAESYPAQIFGTAAIERLEEE